MPETTIRNAASSELDSRMDDWEVTPRVLDVAGDNKETEWINSRASEWLGYYKAIPEVKTAIDTRAIWTIGDGYTADDPRTQAILDHISGWGIDTFDSFLENAVVIKRMMGDFFAEIIRSEDGLLTNLKALNPANIKIIVNREGQIIRYEQINKTIKRTFQPDEIFHLSNKRIADEIHGVSDIEAIEGIIKANQESFEDMKKLMHRHVKPILHTSVDSDNQSEIDAFITKFDDITNRGENLFTPKGTVDKVEVLSVPSNSTLNPMPWREHLRDYFFQVVGIPQIIMGSSGEFTESTAKIAYLAFEQSVKAEQREIIMAVWNQLQLRIDLAFPASLKNELLSDESKDANQGMEFQAGDTTAGVAR